MTTTCRTSRPGRRRACRALGRLLLLLLAGGCGRNEDSMPVTPEGASEVEPAARLYGLQLGARWTYRRFGGTEEARSIQSSALSGGNLRWKEITTCESVSLFDEAARPLSAVLAHVRENRSVTGTTSAHYLVAASEGVLRVRRDDIDEGNLTMAAIYRPPSPRILNGPYTVGRRWEFDLRTAEFEWPRNSNPRVMEFRGANNTSAVDLGRSLPPGDLLPGRLRRRR
jgi:hypothetical protein